MVAGLAGDALEEADDEGIRIVAAWRWLLEE
ncbi:MAG: hypothetical protein ACI8PZ_001386 [Myxococcota bacterium]